MFAAVTGTISGTIMTRRRRDPERHGHYHEYRAGREDYRQDGREGRCIILPCKLAGRHV